MPKNVEDPNIIVGLETSDDAAVYRINDHQALVQTVDYFTPVVDDPFSFGVIAAANALSDIYAMGADPLFALNIIGFPVDKLPLTVMTEIIRGGSTKAAEAGVSILGGHTIKDPEPKYGLVVTGFVHPEEVLTNRGVQPGDGLILTKPLGSGILTHAIKKGMLSSDMVTAVIRLMSDLNDRASRAAVSVRAHACTDVTGFGLLGHLREMLEASGCGAELWLSEIPVFAEDEVRTLARKGIVPGAGRCNLEFLERDLVWECPVEMPRRLILADPQTSGGLLISVGPQMEKELISRLNEEKITAAIIGRAFSHRGIKVKEHRER